MATNRLYIVNTETKQCVCIAKYFDGWSLVNSDALKKFLKGTHQIEKPPLVIGTDNDDDFFYKYIKDSIHV